MLDIIAVGICREQVLGRFSATSAVAVLNAAQREPFVGFKVSGPGLRGEFEPDQAVSAVKNILVKGK
jgi:hypothetical protein